MDDMALMANLKLAMSYMTEQLNTKWKLIELGNISSFLGMEIERDQDSKTDIVSQHEQIKKLLIKVNIQDSKKRVLTPLQLGAKFPPMPAARSLQEIEDLANFPYKGLVGSVLYISHFSHPNISYTVGDTSSVAEHLYQLIVVL